MKQPPFLMSAASAAFTLLAIPTAFAASDPKGIWMDDTGRGAIEIKACGQALCGYVVAVKNASDTKGCGKQIIGDAQSQGAGLWDNGWIYSPEKRKNYDVELKPLANDTLRVVGYAGTKLFSRTMIWTRAPADLKRCDAIEAKAPDAPAAAPVAAKSAETAAKAEAPAPAAPAASAPAAVAPKAIAPAEAATAKAEGAKPVTPAPQASQQPAPPVTSEPQPQTSAEIDSEDEADTDGEKPGKRKSGGGLKLGELDLDKVLTRTKSGKCKLDLPWVKVQFSCDGD